MQMKWTYDKQSGAAYLYVTDEVKKGDVVRAVKVARRDIFIDFDKRGYVLGIEFLNPRAHLPPDVFRKLVKGK